MIRQYSRLFGHCVRYSRSDDAHGTSSVSRCESVMPPATVTSPWSTRNTRARSGNVERTRSKKRIE